MSRIVTLPSARESHGLPQPGGWWHDEAGTDRIVCDLCPRECHLRAGDRGFCFVRENQGGQMVLSTYGRSTGFCIDPIEKKPLNHFFPGTSVLSFGTAGCNLGCKFCQNWSISKSREIEQLSENASPATIAQAALRLGCKSVAFTYNDPVIWAEYAIDTARACREAGVKAVAVTAGYITPLARPAFYEFMDAANVDLKGFSEHFYKHLTLSHLEPVKDTLRWLVHESNVWTEITNLMIPSENDSPEEVRQMCDWIVEALGDEVPVHFTAFHPDFRMLDRARTPTKTLLSAYDTARRAGIKYAYVGNVLAGPQQSTQCPSCCRPVIERRGYTIERYDLAGNRCPHCGAQIAGHFADAPGNWGSRRQPVHIRDFEPSTPPSPMTNPAFPTDPPAPTNPSGTASLTANQQQAILQAAAQRLAVAVTGKDAVTLGDPWAGTAEVAVLGAFVSLKRRGRLRSCCGFLGQDVPLSKAVLAAAERAAADDPRFPPVTSRELPFLDMEVWLLANQQPVALRGEARVRAVEIGKHGLQVARGQNRGLLLPGVAVEHELGAREFLEHVCLKAELPRSAWLEDETQLATFEGRALQGRLEDLLEGIPLAPAEFPLPQSDLPALGEHCRANVLALARGATPSYFAPGVSDGNVHGALVTLLDAEGRELLRADRLSLRGSLPLQSTLFGLCEGLARAAQQNQRVMAALAHSRCAVTLLAAPALQGTVAEPDLRGFDRRIHLLAAIERNRSGAIFDPEMDDDALLASAKQAGGILDGAAAGLYSFTVQTNLPRAMISHVPRPQPGPSARPPAVAGRFYPVDAAELAQLVSQCLPNSAAEARWWPAAMVPHAGLVYSGRIAGQTLQRLQIPRTVIVLGPKHTSHGMEWAVAPHARWSLPGGGMDADPDLASRLCAAIPGLALDAAAHAEEHAIEVELPLLHRLAPHSRVVGIVVGAGDLDRCRQFAAGLASVLRHSAEPPLLLISSDMNHFASDAGNRRLDALALAAMQSLDPERLYTTVVEHRISMCGVLPAVIVMETLRLLGQLRTAALVAYATSADVSGDASRVVGYAGMLLGG